MNVLSPCRRTGRLLAAVLALATSLPVLADKGTGPAGVRGTSLAVTTIDAGTPLTIRVGDEMSFQIFNADVPGTGQIFPSTSSGTADMGWLVHAGGVKYGPDFFQHPAGTATGSLGAVTPYGNRSISPVSGSGTAADPWRVTVRGDLGSTGLVAEQVVEYVNGDNFFTKRLTLTNHSTGTQDVRIFLGGDIYLAGSDHGIPYRDAGSGAVGGSDCTQTNASPAPAARYYILYIPMTPADAWTGAGYGDVWQQIGQGQLDNALSTTSCIDNGAALQWNRSLPPGAGTTIEAVTSFGDLPGLIGFTIARVTPPSGAQGTSVDVTVTGTGFAPGMRLDFGAGITVSDLVVVSGTTATARLVIAPGAALGPRAVQGTSADATQSSTLANGFTVTGAGTPPPAQTRPVPALDAGALAALLLGMLLLALVFLRRGI